ncbi:MAG: OmpA family protein [Cyclobacteriaceae bacterium]
MKACLAFLLTILSIALSAQSVPKLIRIADELYDAQRYIDAIEFYDKISGIDKQNYQAMFRLGFCYNKTLKYDEAKEVFLALGSVTSADNAFQARSLYNYGNLLKLESRFREADSVYSFLIALPSAEPELINSSRKQKEGCLLALRQKREDKGYSVSLMNEINSKFHDFGAVVNPSNKQLVFASTRNLPGVQYEGSQFDGVLPDLVAYESRNNRWRISSSNQKFGDLNTQWSEGSGSFTKDGQTFYFSTCRGENGSDCGIMVSYLVDNAWTDPVPLNDYINEPGAENKQPTISTSGDTLFFSSDRPGGIGGSDIWMSLKGLEQESWTPAINMGDVINSSDNDITPYFSSAFNCLLFASNGHVGYGGYDIYAAKGESFFEPEVYNLGYPFNSTLDDTYFAISDTVGFISSNREDHKNLNLYSFNLNSEKLFLSLLISGESLIDSRIVSKFRDVRSLDLVTFRVEDYQGYELFDPVKRKKPKPRILADQETESSLDSTTIASLETGTGTLSGSDSRRNRIQYETQYFGYGHVMLRPEAKKSMDDLIAQLKNQNYSSISVLAYTDQLGTDTFNIDLSAKRGLAIKAYLSIKGIPLDKINIFARGELKPEEGKDHIYRRIFSRKVEIIVESEQPLELRTAKTYIVTREETVETLARNLSISKDDLAAWNNLRSEKIPSGSTIRIFETSEKPSSSYFVTEEEWKKVFFNRRTGS